MVSLAVAAACNEPTGPSRKQAVASSGCAQTGAILASLEVGPEATPAQRASVVTKHTAACEAAKLTESERGCIARATNTWAAIECAPRAFPKAMKPATKASCAPVVARMRAAIASEMPPAAGSAGTALIGRMMQVAEQACIEDAWPEPFLSCVMASQVGSMASFQACQDLLPKAMLEKVQQAMAAVQPTGEPPAASGSAAGSAGSSTPAAGSAGSGSSAPPAP